MLKYSEDAQNNILNGKLLYTHGNNIIPLYIHLVKS